MIQDIICLVLCKQAIKMCFEMRINFAAKQVVFFELTSVQMQYDIDVHEHL